MQVPAQFLIWVVHGQTGTLVQSSAWNTEFSRMELALYSTLPCGVSYDRNHEEGSFSRLMFFALVEERRRRKRRKRRKERHGREMEERELK